MHLDVYNQSEKVKLKKCYEDYINLYDSDKIPRIVRNKDKACTFVEIMGRCFSKFQQTANLKRLLDSIKENVNRKSAVDE